MGEFTGYKNTEIINKYVDILEAKVKDDTKEKRKFALDYIKKARKEGKSDKEIRKYLNKKGIPNGYLNRHLNEAKGDGTKYKAFFNKMLKKFGVTGISQLKGDKKKEFFKAIEDGWTTEDPKTNDKDVSK